MFGNRNYGHGVRDAGQGDKSHSAYVGDAKRDNLSGRMPAVSGAGEGGASGVMRPGEDVSALITRAAVFAAQAHKGQVYPDMNSPYFGHLERVAKTAARICDESKHRWQSQPDRDSVVVLAYLHDVLEDTSVTCGDLESRFGTRIAESVLAMSKDEGINKEVRMMDSLFRISSLRELRSETAIVKMADRIENLEPYLLPNREAPWYVRKRHAAEDYLKESQLILAWSKRHYRGPGTRLLRERLIDAWRHHEERFPHRIDPWCDFSF
jgi:hypothetical protein